MTRTASIRYWFANGQTELLDETEDKRLAAQRAKRQPGPSVRLSELASSSFLALVGKSLVRESQVFPTFLSSHSYHSQKTGPGNRITLVSSARSVGTIST